MLLSGLFHLLFALFTLSRRIITVPQTPRTPPETDAQVFSFSVRGSGKSESNAAIETPSLVSDPGKWEVSTEELGTTVYRYERDMIVVEQVGKILATFQISSHGSHDTRILVKTTSPSEISCWGGGLSAPNNDHATVQVGNRNFVTSGGFFDGIGLSVFVVGRRNLTDPHESGDPLIVGANLPVYWTKIDEKTHAYYVGGADVDVYLSYSPQKSRRDYLNFLWGITGRPKLPPVFSLGFLVSRWGWEDRDYISSVLDSFDEHGIPIDAFIMDFEWFLNFTGGDYLIPPQGIHEYPDFRFGNQKTFPDIYGQANEYHTRNIKFGGIRKPRLGDSGSKPTRDLNFALPAVREWYADNTKSLLADGDGMPDFWWNDEGETSYFTYYHWIQAEQLADSASGKLRRFSLNRAFTPGMQRLEGVAVWTGDVETTWESLKQNVDMLVRWSEAGVPLVTFDIGGFFGEQGPGYEELLVRWYQVGAFAGVMRVHSTLKNTPHFPLAEFWSAEAVRAMRMSIHFRYLLLPTLVTALHAMKNSGIPWIERKDPKSKEAAEDFLVADRKLFVVPVLKPMNATNEPAGVNIDFPTDAFWYPLQSKAPIIPQQTITMPSVPLFAMPVYAREGSIILLHGGAISETTRATEIVGAGHTLLILLFVHSQQPVWKTTTSLIEDDGEGLESLVRETIFEFTQSSGGLHLRWDVKGSADAPRWYADILVNLRLPTGEEIEAKASLVNPSGSQVIGFAHPEEQKYAKLVSVVEA